MLTELFTKQYDHIASSVINYTLASGMTGHNLRVRKSADVVSINGYVSIGSTALSGSGGLVMTLPTEARPKNNAVDFFAEATYGSSKGLYSFVLNTDGTLKSNIGSSTLGANTTIVFPSVVYMI